ncbi:uncharacterized protein LOC117102329 isoform X2 [Anneissia japonica]|uniref:uncharacterized protein LOC117102329 isoform X2 n=1 Tax=Anneissia japonica TaxID=1529436 RepID=UPI001425B895|nr:uncharacterized protein LOC117102329 isoform X2 [Anneissia japonica]
MEFNLLKTIVSNWYGGESNVSMLKVLFRDKVEKGNLSSVTSTIDLLNNLFTSDHLSSWNLGLLCDTISITKHFALQWEIKKKLPSFPEVKKGTISTEFTPHRQKLMKFGLALTTDNVKEIDGLYNTLPKMYTSSWIMITDLEDRLIISEGNLKIFIDRLRTILNLQQALNTLAEDL